MANTAMLLIGGLGLAYLLGNKPSDQDDTGGDQVLGLGGVVGSGSALGDLLGADRNSSGVGAFNQPEPTDQGEGLLSALTGMFSTFTAGFTGNTAGDANELDPNNQTSENDVLIEATPFAVTGSLNPFFNVQGPTVSEISGNAVRQVGLLMPGEEILNLTPVTLSGELNPIGRTEVIQILPSNQSKPSVFTYQGGDGAEVVLDTSINRNSEAYYTTLNTLTQSILQEPTLWEPKAAYVAQSVKQLESAFAASEEGIASRSAKQDAISDAYAYVASLNSKEVAEAPVAQWNYSTDYE